MKEKLLNEILDELCSEPKDSDLYPYIRNALKQYIEIYGRPKWVGRNRAVWKIKKDWVEKVPRNMEGLTDNDFEVSTYEKSKKWAKEDRTYARCSLKSTKDGISICVMEFARYIEDPKKFGEDAQFLADFTDCGQIGKTKDGRIVSFDYGYF